MVSLVPCATMLPTPPAPVISNIHGQFSLENISQVRDDVRDFQKVLVKNRYKIKVDGRVGNLGDQIVIKQAGEGKIEIIAHNELSGRYLKYLYVAAHDLVRA